MNPTPRPQNAALALLALALMAGPSLAQQAEPPVFGETVEVRVVNLEVVVNDKQGLPVTGLAARDFVLKVDGVEQPIDYFTEVRGGDAIEGAPEPGQPEIPGVPQLAPGSAVGTSYLVFIDEYFSMPNDRNKVLGKLSEDLSRLGPDDRMAIVAYDGRELEMLSTWSQSVPELERVVRRAIARPAHGLQRLSELRTLSEDRRANRWPGRQPTLDARLEIDERYFLDNLVDQVKKVISASAAALRGFANPPGRKVFLLLSGGWPYDPVEYTVNDARRTALEPDAPRGEDLYAPLVGTANQLGYTIYTVDVPGLTDDSSASAEYAAPGDFADRARLFRREYNVQASLQLVAEETGGKALLNGNRERALSTAAADTRSYYWLGFAPKWVGDDGKHRVDVTTRVAGLEVRNRAGYVDFSRRRETSMAVESVLLFGDAPGAGALPLELGDPVKASGNTMNVPVKVRIPLDHLTALPSGDRYVATVEVRAAALDDKGGRSEVPVLPVQLEMPGEPPPGAYATYSLTLQLRRAKNQIVVAVSDPVSGAIFSGRAEIAP